jgi:hypothetical protein
VWFKKTCTFVNICDFGSVILLELGEKQTATVGPHHTAHPVPPHDSDWLSPKLQKKRNRAYWKETLILMFFLSEKLSA